MSFQCQKFTRITNLVDFTIVAPTFQKPKGEVGCEALSFSLYGHWQRNHVGTETAETPPDQHLNKASAKQSTAANIFEIVASFGNIVAECCDQRLIS